MIFVQNKEKQIRTKKKKNGLKRLEVVDPQSRKSDKSKKIIKNRDENHQGKQERDEKKRFELMMSEI